MIRCERRCAKAAAPDRAAPIVEVARKPEHSGRKRALYDRRALACAKISLKGEGMKTPSLENDEIETVFTGSSARNASDPDTKDEGDADGTDSDEKDTDEKDKKDADEGDKKDADEKDRKDKDAKDADGTDSGDADATDK